MPAAAQTHRPTGEFVTGRVASWFLVFRLSRSRSLLHVATRHPACPQPTHLSGARERVVRDNGGWRTSTTPQ